MTAASLILVSGAPGAGKTTLARRLAGELGLPLLSKDDVKEDLAAVLPADGLERSRELGRAAVTVLYGMAARLSAAGVPLILESAFHAGVSENDLRPLTTGVHAVSLHCEVDTETAGRRHRARHGRRHPVHHDAARHVDVTDARWEPPALGIPSLRIDCRHGYRPGWAEIVRFTGHAPAASA
ncbi:putative kinase [Stackebrandtia albiflava]|uniref:Putative kinase n=1 Tax=Stackebrandtia albiflava TaxID=406432 RepID=A0A562VD64_9ACTN|nr:AAA family ATPase [Stackebrandtia albiflava]TWJ15767.1 putative kinase [Stackebrandtia albiflava]